MLAEDEGVVDACREAWNALAEAGRLRSLAACPHLEGRNAWARRYRIGYGTEKIYVFDKVGVE